MYIYIYMYRLFHICKHVYVRGFIYTYVLSGPGPLPPPAGTVVVFSPHTGTNPDRIQGRRTRQATTTAIGTGTRAPFARRKRQQQILYHRNDHRQEYISTDKRLQLNLCKTHCPSTIVCQLVSSNPQHGRIWETKHTRDQEPKQDHRHHHKQYIYIYIYIYIYAHAICVCGKSIYLLIYLFLSTKIFISTKIGSVYTHCLCTLASA